MTKHPFLPKRSSSHWWNDVAQKHTGTLMERDFKLELKFAPTFIFES
jgi:hypothetical protein